MDPRVPEPISSPPQCDLTADELTIGEKLGEGSQAAVFEATIDRRDGPDRVAVRTPPTTDPLGQTFQPAETDAFFDRLEPWRRVDEFERTADSWADSHRVLGVVATGESIPWAALEYVDGGRLADLIERSNGGLKTTKALWFGEQIARAAHLADEANVTHLDIRPANVLLSRTASGSWSYPKLADWGAAHRADGDSHTGDTHEQRHPYAAPEQIAATGPLDRYTDIYRCGAVLYALLTGEPPVGDDGRAVVEVPSDTTPEPPSAVRDGFDRVDDDRIDRIVTTALATDRADRYDSARLMAEDLRSARLNEDPPNETGMTPRGTAGDTARGTAGDSPDETGRGGQTADETGGGSETGRAVIHGERLRHETTWSQLCGRPSRAGTDGTDYGPATEPEVVWQERLGPNAAGTGRYVEATLVSSPVVVDGTVYVGGPQGLIALDAATGSRRWRKETDAHVRTTPAVVDDRVYAGDDDGTVYAVDATDGTKLWKRETDDAVESSPAVVDGRVVVGSDDGTVYALRVRDGGVDWTHSVGRPVKSSPAVTAETVFVGAHDDRIHALRLTDGHERWRLGARGSVQSSPAVDGDTVYVGSHDCRLYALATDRERGRWQFETNGLICSSPAVADDRVFVGSYDCRLYAVVDGREEWSIQMDEWVRGAPAVADGVVYAGDDDGTVYAVDAADGDQFWTKTLHSPVASSPTPVDGRLFVSTPDTLYALRAPGRR